MTQVVFTTFQATPVEFALLLTGIMGIVLAILGILTNVRGNSPIRVDVINRAGFYGVAVVLITCMIYLNTSKELATLSIVQSYYA